MTSAFLNTKIDIINDMYESVNLLKGIKPIIKDADGNEITRIENDLSINPECYKMLTDYPDHGKHIDIFSAPLTITYDLGNKQQFDRFDIYGFQSPVFTDLDLSLGEFELYAADTFCELYNTENKLFYHNNSGLAKFCERGDKNELTREYCDFAIETPNCEARFVGLKIIKANAFDDIVRLTHIGVYNDELTKSVNAKALDENNSCGTSKRQVEIDCNDIVLDDFFGVGVNCIPMALMKEAIEQGSSEAFFEVFKKRYIDTRPAVVRLWFQLDWFIMSGEDYYNRVYNFDSDKMKGVYKYLDAFLEAGSEIEFNFGWKISKDAQNWFSYPCTKPEGSAPVDLFSFVHSCCALLKELFKRGYDNIKYLTFFNEPQNGDDFMGPFKTIDECGKYFRLMLDYAYEELKRQNLSDKLQIWGPEDGWMKSEIELTNSINFGENSPIDALTFHRYNIGYEEARHLFKKLKDETCKRGEPLLMTESGIDEFYHTWQTNPVSNVMAVTHFGLSGILNWVIDDVIFTDPLLFTMTWQNNFWGLPNAKGIETIYGTFYYYSLYSRYLPPHSMVLNTKNDNNDIRTAAYKTPSGDIVVAVEVMNAPLSRELVIDFGDGVGRKFYKHCISKHKHYDYILPSHDGNAIVPPCCKVIETNGVLCDTLTTDYQFILYTTEKPFTQIAMKTVHKALKPGESFKVEPFVIDGDDSCGYEYSVSCSGKNSGTVDKDGVYTADKCANIGDTVAVIAKLNNTKSYGVTVISIV